MLDIACNLLGAALLLPLGMALGSFFELVLDRVPRGESVLWPPSHCRACGRRLTVDELIPVVSYLAQHGRCRACETPIGAGVPVREAWSGLVVAVPWAIVGCGHPGFAAVVGTVLLLGMWVTRAVREIRRPSAAGKRPPV